MFYVWCAVLWIVAGCSNEAPAIRNREPGLAFAPSAFDFGDVGVPLDRSIPFFVSNTGGADMLVRLTFEDFPSIFTIDGETEFELAPGDERELEVQFAPGTYREYTTVLRLDSNDPQSPLENLPVTGTGADLPLPDIAVRPGLTVEVDGLTPGEEAFLLFEVVNEGGSALEVRDIRLEGPASFVLETDRTGATLLPNGSTAVLVEYQQLGLEGEFADVFVTSNDPDEPEVQVRLIANGGGPDFQRPIAQIDCPATFGITGPQFLRLSGAESYDPAGLEPLTYEWTVTERPKGADEGVALDPDDLEFVDVYVDVAGEWEVQLVVENSLGTPSEPALCRFGATPEDALRVELSWTGAAADVDLHLLNGVAAELCDPVDDCGWHNPTPKWGPTGGGSADDPRLDIDDRAGFGPENINIEAPAEGAYPVKVHYYKTNGDGAITATVNVLVEQ